MEQRLEAMSSQLLKKQILIDELNCGKAALQARLRSALASVTKLERAAEEDQTNNNQNSHDNDLEHGKGSMSKHTNSGSVVLRQRSSNNNGSIARLPPFAKHKTAAKVADAVDQW